MAGGPCFRLGVGEGPVQGSTEMLEKSGKEGGRSEHPESDDGILLYA